MGSVVQRSATVPYSPAAMFDLVADVEAYPEFLPWCVSARVRRCNESEVEATLEVAKGPLRAEFTTRNVAYRAERIDLHLLEGPFTYLEGSWRFAPAARDGCRVSLRMAFEFSPGLVSATLTPAFEELAGTMVEAFRDRAEVLYGGR